MIRPLAFGLGLAAVLLVFLLAVLLALDLRAGLAFLAATAPPPPPTTTLLRTALGGLALRLTRRPTIVGGSLDLFLRRFFLRRFVLLSYSSLISYHAS